MRFALTAALAALLATPALAQAAPELAIALTLKDHRFVPDRISVPAGVRIRINLSNQDGFIEEFDSDDLHVERDVTPHGKTSFVVGPLVPGTYSFMGELHALTAQGLLTVTQTP